MKILSKWDVSNVVDMRGMFYDILPTHICWVFIIKKFSLFDKSTIIASLRTWIKFINLNNIYFSC